MISSDWLSPPRRRTHDAAGAASWSDPRLRERPPVNLTQLQRFVAVVDHGIHVPRAAQALGIPLASLNTSLDKLEAEVGHPLFVRSKPSWSLTPAGTLLLDEARAQLAAAPAQAAAQPKVPAGGKAKASKGKGRAPIVKGQPKPYKKRQGR